MENGGPRAAPSARTRRWATAGPGTPPCGHGGRPGPAPRRRAPARADPDQGDGEDRRAVGAAGRHRNHHRPAGRCSGGSGVNRRCGRRGGGDGGRSGRRRGRRGRGRGRGDGSGGSRPRCGSSVARCGGGRRHPHTRGGGGCRAGGGCRRGSRLWRHGHGRRRFEDRLLPRCALGVRRRGRRCGALDPEGGVHRAPGYRLAVGVELGGGDDVVAAAGVGDRKGDRDGVAGADRDVSRRTLPAPPHHSLTGWPVRANEEPVRVILVPGVPLAGVARSDACGTHAQAAAPRRARTPRTARPPTMPRRAGLCPLTSCIASLPFPSDEAGSGARMERSGEPRGDPCTNDEV